MISAFSTCVVSSPLDSSHSFHKPTAILRLPLARLAIQHTGESTVIERGLQLTNGLQALRWIQLWVNEAYDPIMNVPAWIQASAVAANTGNLLIWPNHVPQGVIVAEITMRERLRTLSILASPLAVVPDERQGWAHSRLAAECLRLIAIKLSGLQYSTSLWWNGEGHVRLLRNLSGQ